MKRTGLLIASLGLFLFAGIAQADWTPAKRLTWTDGLSRLPAIVVDASGNLHLVFEDYTPGDPEIYYKKSTNGGASWTTTKSLTRNWGNSWWPDIAADSLGRIHVVWQCPAYTFGISEIFYRKSYEGGATWTTIKRLTWTSGKSELPAVAVDSSDNVHVVWNDDTPSPLHPEIYYKKSTDGGATWTASKRLTWTSGLSIFGNIAVDSFGNLHLVFEDYTPGHWEIYYKKSTDGGASWTATKRLNWTSSSSVYPKIAVDPSGNLHVVWKNYTPGGSEIYYKKSTDGGATWTASKRLTWTSGPSSVADIAVDSFGNIHIVWQELTSKYEIHYKQSTDGGATWTVNKALSLTSGNCYIPVIAIDPSDNLHVVWEDDTPGNGEIYYRKYVK